MTDAAAPPIVVGRVRKPHGLKGEVAIFPLTDDPESVFVPGQLVSLANMRGDALGELKVVQARIYHRECLLKFADHDRREAVEDFRGLFLTVPRDVLPPLDDGEVYQQELVGWAVRNEQDEALGIVSDVYDLPQGTTIEVQGAAREFMLPFRGEYIKEIDRAGRRLVIAIPDGLIE